MIYTVILHFDAVVNGIFFISLFDSLLLVYKNATYFHIFHILWLDWIYLLVQIVFFGESLGFSLYNIVASANSEFYFFISNLDAVSLSLSLFLSLLFIQLLQLSYPMVCWKIWQEWASLLVLGLKGKIVSFPALLIILSVGLSYLFFIMLRYIPSISTLLRIF